MSRFYVRPEHVVGENIKISGDEAHHVLDVMRLKEGDEVIAFDGLGNEYKGTINEAKRKTLTVLIQDRLKKPVLATKISIVQAIPKSEKMDYIIQKCAELGVRLITPMVTERTIVRLDKDRESGRLARWTKIAISSSKQCGRSDVMEISKVRSFKDAVESNRGSALKIIPSLMGERKKLVDVVSTHKSEDIVVFIGPEGGFSPGELNLAMEHRFEVVSLGPYTLKSDTAAIASAAIITSVLTS